jgi:hypothetical protein
MPASSDLPKKRATTPAAIRHPDTRQLIELTRLINSPKLSFSIDIDKLDEELVCRKPTDCDWQFFTRARGRIKLTRSTLLVSMNELHPTVFQGCLDHVTTAFGVSLL